MRISILPFLLVLAACLLLATSEATIASEADSSRLFNLLDADGNGQLASGEIRPEHAALFSRLIHTSDYDNNRLLSQAEFTHSLQPQRFEKPIAEKQNSNLPGANALMLLIAKMDTNGDQRIEANEVPDRYYPFFERIEQRLGNESEGRIDRRELIQAAPRLSQIALRFARQQGIDVEAELAHLPKEKMAAFERMDRPTRPLEALSDPEQAKQIFARLDVNDDGQLSAEEVPEPFAQAYERFLKLGDKNGDRQLSKKEFLDMSRRMAAYKMDQPSPNKVKEEVAQLLKRLDRNSDQRLSPDELPQRLAKRFDRLDTDHDGSLDQQELGRAVILLSRMRDAEKTMPRSAKPPRRRNSGK